MRTFMVAYRFDDCPKINRKLEPLRRAIESLGAFSHPLDSVWIVCTVHTIQEIRERLSAFFERDDRLLIVECGEEAEWQGFPVDTAVWLDHEFNASRRPSVRRHPS